MLKYYTEEHMNRPNVKYKIRKDEIYHFYSHFNKLDADTIEDANDHIIDVDLKKEHFDNPIEEFYNILSMCSYMANNDLYDEYFFETLNEIIEDYNKGIFDDYIDDKELIDKDIEEIKEHLKKDEMEKSYYNNLSDIYNNMKEE